jgi:DNA-binding LytR/AlgR family response regulator
MIVKLEQDLTKHDIEIIIKYAKMNREVERVTSLIQLANKRLKCAFDGNEKIVNASDIYYIESVDKRTFVYCENEVYRTEFRLYKLTEELAKLGFVQISKSCILNINILDTIKPLMNSRMEATLKNGERLFITRKYLANIKEKLQKGVLT